jgi:hypothetical protein
MASKQYFAPETAVVFKSSGGDVVFTVESTANSALAHSAQRDRGAGSKPGFFRWFARVKGSTTLTIGAVIKIYLAQAQNATVIPGRLPATDGEIATGADLTRNLSPVIGLIVADTTTSGASLNSSGTCFIWAQFISVVYLNELGQALSATAGDFEFVLQPIPPEQQ